MKYEKKRKKQVKRVGVNASTSLERRETVKTKNISRSELINNSFYKLPKFLFSDDFSKMSNDAKVLYAILLDRMSLSTENNWFDDNDDVYIYYKVEKICEIMQRGNKTVIKLKKELQDYSLISEKRQGVNKPNRIYVRNLLKNRKCKNDTSRNVKNTSQEVYKLHTNKTKSNKTENSKTTTSKKNVVVSPDSIKFYKDLIYNSIGVTVKDKRIKNWITDKKEEDIKFYLDNWSKWDYKTKYSEVGFYIDLVENKRPLPKFKKGQGGTPEQMRNYSQREYSDEYFNSLYDNDTLGNNGIEIDDLGKGLDLNKYKLGGG